MPESREASDAGPGTVALFLPIGIGLAIGLNAGRDWAAWGATAAAAFAASHVALKSWHFRQYVAGAGASASVPVYLVMRFFLEVLKVGVPIALVFAVRGAPFRIGKATPWPSQAKAAYVGQCSADMAAQGLSAGPAVDACGCIADAFEAEFGMEEYETMMKAQPRRRGSGVEQRLYFALSSCPVNTR